MPLDLILSPLYRKDGQEAASIPGLLLAVPPRKTARGREQDRLLVYLLLTGNTSLSSEEYMRLASDAANRFHQSTGSMTHALRTAAEFIHRTLLERNLSTSGRGQYMIAWLTLAALRESQCTLLLSGPMHVYWLGQDGSRHIHEPAISGKGLGLSQAMPIHYSQAVLQPGDRLLLCGRVPAAWESTLKEAAPSSLDTTRRRLLTLTGEDINAVLIQAAEGNGRLAIVKETSRPKVEPFAEPLPPLSDARRPAPVALPDDQVEATNAPREMETASLPAEEVAQQPAAAHVVQPSAYAIPSQLPEMVSPAPVDGDTASQDLLIRRSNPRRDFPSSIPRVSPQGRQPEPPAEEKVPPIFREDSQPPEAPREPSERTRQAAKALVTGIKGVRHVTARGREWLQRFIPRLFPGTTADSRLSISTPVMMLAAILIPVLVVTIAFTVYFKYGYSIQYEVYRDQAREFAAQAASPANPVEQRKAWENVLLNVERAEDFRSTDETAALRQQAETQLDRLLGNMRLPFQPVFSSNLGIEISRMAASETDLYMLNASSGEVLRAELKEGGFQLDPAFNCAPALYGDTSVGTLVDILAMPGLNAVSATMLGIDATGNLLYCAPKQVAQAIPLPPPDTNWGRVTAFTMDGGNLYVLDAQARAVWVYTGKDGTFVDRPYFFFGDQTPEKQDVIDLLVSGDDLFMLHADGHLSTCSYSRIEGKPTRCTDPAALTNPFAAYQDLDLFGTAHITQMAFTAPPDQSILLLSADDQAAFRITPRSLELQNQIRPATGSPSTVTSGPVGAMAVGPNHVLYFAVKGQVYFATGMP